MTPATPAAKQTAAASTPTSGLGIGPERHPDKPPVRWGVVVPIVLIGAVVLLTALPLGAVWIVSNSGCCVFDGMENVATFWGSLTAGFLALFGMVITGVFVITSFRTDATARTQAQDAVANYLRNHRREFVRELEQFQEEVRENTKKVITASETASTTIQEHQKTAKDAADKAEAQIGSALEGVEGAAKGANEKIVLALGHVEEQSTDAVGRIDAARDAVEAARNTVEAAAAAALRRIDEVTRSLPRTPPPEDERD